MFRHYTSSDISFAIGKFENVVGIFEGPERRQAPHYKTKLGPSAWNATRFKNLVDGMHRTDKYLASHFDMHYITDMRLVSGAYPASGIAGFY